jgi:ABC-type lipoprotein export system ATPase subunit
MSKTASQRLKEVRIVGGFLDGVSYKFSDKLNCIIGARGTGKTSILEIIRYALNSMPTDPAARKRIENLVESNLNGGRVDVEIETCDGLGYIISRNVGDAPIVMDLNRNATGLALSPAIFRIDMFSQNEIENIADRSMSQLALLETFDQERLSDFNSRIDQLRTALRANATAITPLRKKYTELSERISILPALTEKLKTYEITNTRDAEVLNQSLTQKTIRDREQRLFSDFGNAYERIAGKIETQQDLLQNAISGCLAGDVSSGENFALVEAVYAEIDACNAEVNKTMDTALQIIGKSRERLAEFSNKLTLAHQRQEVAHQSLLERNLAEQAKSSERMKLERQRNELLSLQKKLDEVKSEGVRLRRERVNMLTELANAQDQRFALLNGIVNRINDSLKPSIRVSIVQFGNQTPYIDLLANELKNSGVQSRGVAKKLVQCYSPKELVEIIHKASREELLKRAGLNDNQASVVFEKLKRPEFLTELEIVEQPDLPKIELNDHESYKTTETLSTGQKCNTILPILLLESDRPLMIDQPEDNLDNGFVHSTIVESIIRVKQTRQLVFVTHNPNIPVLSDADRLLVLESDGQHGHVRNAGDVDECKNDIVSLLEGGEEAFKKRKNRYSY